MNELLGREPVDLDDHSLYAFLGGKAVLVTGAGGSIGSELCRQIVRYGPSRLYLVDNCENALFEIQQELRAMPVEACLCDISREQHVDDLWCRVRPQVVLHAAAHKHVPMLEHNVRAAVVNNALGTATVIHATAAAKAESFVMLSTDKAIKPTSIMGLTKRFAELFGQAMSAAYPTTRFMAVRFGNVMDSRGSVVPIFRKQIEAGGPVTVTDPEMRRYFMTIPEAASLVLQAAAIGESGQVFLLDMGEPVRIVDLARQMIALSGKDIAIKYTGIRPGEKLFEELNGDAEYLESTPHPKIRAYRRSEVPERSGWRAWDRLVTAEECGEVGLAAELMQAVLDMQGEQG